MNNFENTYIKLKESDKTTKRVKEIANKYSQASGYKLEPFLKLGLSYRTSNWLFIQSCECLITVEDSVEDYQQEITEQDLDNHLSQINSKQCCEGGELTAGCFHDNCTGAISMNKEEDVTQWFCFQEVADVIGEEAAEFELEKVRLLHLERGNELNLVAGQSLLRAFSWNKTPQDHNFWESIDCGKVPDEYEQKPFKPTLDISEALVKRIKETFSDNTIGSLVEKLHTSLLPSNVTISVNGNGHIIISGDKIPTVDVTKLEASEITKAYEAMVMLEGCFVEYNESEGERL